MDKRSLFFIFLLTLALLFVQNWFDSKKNPPVTKVEEVQIEKKIEATAAPCPVAPNTTESFYVIENDSMQLVFSNIGGALSEINLPLTSQNSTSLVHPIEFDKTIAKTSPRNGTFPLNEAKAYDGKTAQKVGGYYPLLRRSILNSQGEVVHKVSPCLYALLLTKPQEVIPSYIVTRHEKDLIEFTATTSDRKITKRFSFPKDKNANYLFDLSIQVEGDTKQLWLSSGIPEVEMTSGSSTPIIKYRLTRGTKQSVELLDLPKEELTMASLSPDWICNSNGFLGLILDPKDTGLSGIQVKKIDGVLAPTRLSLIDQKYNLYPLENFPSYDAFLNYPPTEKTLTFRVFAGPFQNKLLKTLDKIYENPETGINPDYIGAQSFHGWFAFISEPFAKFLFFLMNIFHTLTSSWGISIILLTVALRILLYPLNSWQIKSMAKMQELAPQVTAIQNKYKKEPKKAQIEIMQLYREKGANPFSGCFPILIQMPFLIGMFDLLKSSFELRGVSFIPGWIDNLTAPDVIFSWGYPIFFFGTTFHLLPFLLGLVMYVQQKFSSTVPKDKSLLTDQQKQQQTMSTIMTVVFTVMFYHFPSGLNIYWLSSMLLGILQQWVTMKYVSKKHLAIKKR